MRGPAGVAFAASLILCGCSGVEPGAAKPSLESASGAGSSVGLVGGAGGASTGLSASGSGGSGTSSGGRTSAGGSSSASGGATTTGSGAAGTPAGGTNAAGTGAGGKPADPGPTGTGGRLNGAGGMDGSTGGTSMGVAGMMSNGSAGMAGMEPDPNCVVDLNCTPDPLPSTGDFAQDCVDRINQFRVGCHCLPPLERWPDAEMCADANAAGDQGTGMAHSSWGRNGVCSESSGALASEFNGFATNECPGYRSSTQVISLCLQQMYDEGAAWAQQLGRTPEQADYDSCNDSCYSTNGHFIAMTNSKYSMVACGIYDDVMNDIWSVQNFR